jgi:hypothetical protein
MIRTAMLSACGQYRLELRRIWSDALPLLVVVMLNPSTADAEKDDPTLRALMWFATLWGYGGLLVVNLRAYRTSKPAELFAAHAAGVNTIGPDNHLHVGAALDFAAATSRRVLVAWGTGGADLGLDAILASRVRARGLEMICLGRNKNLSPKHPAARGHHRVPRDQQPLVWHEPA